MARGAWNAAGEEWRVVVGAVVRATRVRWNGALLPRAGYAAECDIASARLNGQDIQDKTSHQAPRASRDAGHPIHFQFLQASIFSVRVSTSCGVRGVWGGEGQAKLSVESGRGLDGDEWVPCLI